MIKGIKIDIATQTIIVSKKFVKAASKVGSPEYDAFQKVKADNENYNVIVREIKKNTEKKTYAGLDYDYMRSYIMTHEERENIIPTLNEFEELVTISRCHSAGYRYPIIKNWFLERYSEIKEYGMPPVSSMDVPSIEQIVEDEDAA